MHRNLIALLTVIALFTPASQAAILGDVNLFYWSHDTVNGSTTTNTTYLNPSITFGWVSAGGLLLGATYDAWSTSATGSSSTTLSYTNYGPSIGYVAPNWYLIATYLMSATYTDAQSSSTTTYTGTGTRVEIGYMFTSGELFLGPSIVYDARTYTQETSPTSMAITNQSITDILPFFTIGFLTK
jgi:hypothetical protein